MIPDEPGNVPNQTDENDLDPFGDDDIRAAQATPVEPDQQKPKDKKKLKKKKEKDGGNLKEELQKHKLITFLNNVPLLVSAELSSTRINMKELLSYKKGSIIQLDKLAGEPMDILINSEYVAKGEVVVVNGRYAVRFTDMIEKLEILNKKYNETVV